MVVVIQYHYDRRDLSMMQPAIKSVSEVFGPFTEDESAKAWLANAPSFDGWGTFEYEIKEVVPPGSNAGVV